MHPLVRAMVVPFCMVLFPALHYVFGTFGWEQSEYLILGTVGAVLTAAIVAGGIAWFRNRDRTRPRDLPRPQRILQPDDIAIRLFVLFVGISLLWGAVSLIPSTPEWIDLFVTLLVIPLGLPLLILSPLVIGFQWAVIAGYVLSVLWMALLATLGADVIYART